VLTILLANASSPREVVSKRDPKRRHERRRGGAAATGELFLGEARIYAAVVPPTVQPSSIAALCAPRGAGDRFSVAEPKLRSRIPTCPGNSPKSRLTLGPSNEANREKGDRSEIQDYSRNVTIAVEAFHGKRGPRVWVRTERTICGFEFHLKTGNILIGASPESVLERVAAAETEIVRILWSAFNVGDAKSDVWKWPLSGRSNANDFLLTRVYTRVTKASRDRAHSISVSACPVRPTSWRRGRATGNPTHLS